MQTAERISHRDASDNFVFQRSLLAYHEAARLVCGNVLEIGTGSGYGVEVIAPHADRFVSIDKHNPRLRLPVEFQRAATGASNTADGTTAGSKTASNGTDNTARSAKTAPEATQTTLWSRPEEPQPPTLLRAKVPPLPFPNGSFDTVITFQVIEHIRRDEAFVAEVARVLKPGGRLVISTPNAAMSLTRNPWHVREYTPDQLAALLQSHFGTVRANGIFGRENVMKYYENNRRSVARVARWDVLGVRNWLPRWALRVPYDLLNRLNRRRLLNANEDLTLGIAMSDYFLAPVAPTCFDLFYIAEK